ncbi:phosphodiester glycosidase family protein [Streptomyces sp. NPDC048845]|uniref:phosphodiester glycosidase family protein n=1 Tax=Streptomyces sp. NPDC048845 TaxID=3155390 RepID=UPI00343E498F
MAAPAPEPAHPGAAHPHHRHHPHTPHRPSRPSRPSRPRRMPRTAVLTSLATAATLLAPGAAPANAAPEPGRDAVREQLAGWAHERVAPGVDLYRGTVRGRAGADHWTLTVRSGGAQLLPEDTARQLAGRLREAGFEPRTERVEWPAGSDRDGLLGLRVRVGVHGGQNQAEVRRKKLTAAGFDALTEWTGGDGTPDTGLARLTVAVVDPEHYDGELDASYGEAVAGREKVTDMARGERALLGLNAGFFVMEPEDGVPGAAAGIAAYDGELQSAATNGRIAAVLRGDGLRPELRHLSTRSTVHAGSGPAAASETVDGINRVPGLIRNCGGVGADRPTEAPRHDVTCTDPNEIVRFTGELGTGTPPGPGTEAVLDAEGRVTAVRPRGGPVPEDGSVLAGIGTGGDWLRSHAVPGSVLRVEDRITDARGRRVELGPRDDIVNGGPQLVRDGRVAVDYGTDGTAHPGNPTAAYTWGIKRNPRTFLGTDARGRILLVTSAGRQPGYSDGLGLNEGAELMRRLGAVNAMNLDGGGSTAMAVHGRLVTMPSDAAGERPVGDGLFLKNTG